MIENKDTSFNDILDSLSKISSSFTLSIFIPSLKQNIQFKELNAKQQKKLLETKKLALWFLRKVIFNIL